MSRRRLEAHGQKLQVNLPQRKRNRLVRTRMRRMSNRHTRTSLLRLLRCLHARKRIPGSTNHRERSIDFTRSSHRACDPMLWRMSDVPVRLPQDHAQQLQIEMQHRTWNQLSRQSLLRLRRRVPRSTLQRLLRSLPPQKLVLQPSSLSNLAHTSRACPTNDHQVFRHLPQQMPG